MSPSKTLLKLASIKTIFLLYSLQLLFCFKAMYLILFTYCIGYRPGVTPDQLVDIASDPVYTWFYTQGNQISTQTAAKFVQLFGQCKHDILIGVRQGFNLNYLTKYFVIYNIVDFVCQCFNFELPRGSFEVYK